jgi:hypothetical protein
MSSTPPGVSMAARVQAVLGGLALIAAALWGFIHPETGLRWLLGGSFGIPLGIVLVVGGLLPGRDARAALHAGKVLAQLASPGSTPDSEPHPDEGAPPDIWVMPSPQRLASLVFWTLAVCSLLLAFAAPFALLALFTDVPFQPIQGLAIAALFGVGPLFKLARRLEQSLDTQPAVTKSE